MNAEAVFSAHHHYVMFLRCVEMSGGTVADVAKITRDAQEDSIAYMRIVANSEESAS